MLILFMPAASLIPETVDHWRTKSSCRCNRSL